MLRRLGEQRPPLLLLENVVGLVTGRCGEDFRLLLRLISSVGYGVDVFVLSAKHFLPQSRPRLYVVGAAPHLRTGQPQFRACGPLRTKPLLNAVQTCDPAGGWLNLELPHPPELKVRLDELLDLSDSASWWDRERAEKRLATCSEDHAKFLRAKAQRTEIWAGTAFWRTSRRKSAGRKKRLEIRRDGLAGCLLRGSGSSLQHVVTAGDGRIRLRWMTAAEYAALQGVAHLPGRAEGVARSAYADGVCVPAVRWVDQHVLTPLRDGRRRS